jgi:hypothetical protein
MAIWVIKDGQREGPYEEQDVRELVYEGTYSDAEPAIRDGQVDWTTVGHILGRQPPPPPEFVPPPELSTVGAPPVPAAPGDVPVATDGPPAASARRRIPVAQSVQVAVVDFQMPFGSMVILMVKWAVAAIPAVLILIAISFLFSSFFLGVLAALFHH